MNYLQRELAFPIERVQLFSSPFRNFAGQQKRMPILGLDGLADPNDTLQISALVAGALGK